METLNEIILITATVIGAVAAIFFAVWLYKKSDSEGRIKILESVRIFVEAAEQLYKGKGRGSEKKAFVLESLKKLGFTVDGNALDAMIEAAVYELNSVTNYLIKKESDKEE